MMDIFIEESNGDFDIDIMPTGTSIFKLGYHASDFDSLALAIATIGSTPGTLYINTPQVVTDNLIIPSTLSVDIVKPGLITISSGKTLTINGSLQVGLYQIFSGTGTVVFGNNSVKRVFPQWWGGLPDSIYDQTTYIEKAIATGIPVIMINGTWLCNITITDIVNARLSGTSFDTMLKTFDDVNPVITINSTTVQTIGTLLSTMTIDGHSLSKGIYMTAAAPYVITKSIIEKLRIINVTKGIHIYSATQAEEVYSNIFRDIYIENVVDGTAIAFNMGIYINGGVYNTFANINVVDINNYAYGIYSYATSNSFFDIVADGCIRCDGQNNSWYNTSVEAIHATTPPDVVVFRSAGNNATIIGLNVIECANAKCNFALAVWNYNSFISKVRIYGTDYPQYSVLLDADSSGVLLNVQGGLYTVIQGNSEAKRKNWLIKNCGETGRSETFETAVPTTYYSNRGDKCWNSAPSTGVTPGWVCVTRIDTEIRIQANATDTTIEVDDTTGMIAGDLIGIVLDNGVIHYTTIDTVSDGDTLIITAGIPASRHADVDAAVYTNRWKAMTNLT